MDILTETLQKLVQFVESASPVIWETAMRQVYVYAVGHLVWAAFFAALAIGLFYVIRKIWQARRAIQAEKQATRAAGGYYYGRDEDDDEITAILASIGAISCAITALGLAQAGVARFVNPTFYAIRLLLDGMPK